MASDVRTAVSELYPYYDQTFSVATIRVKDGLKIADLSQGGSGIKDDFIRHLSLLIQDRISKGGSEKDYIFSRYVASLCKKLGHDGIGYRSKYSTHEDVRNKTGINYTIFNYEKCEAIESKLKNVEGLSVKIDDYFN